MFLITRQSIKNTVTDGSLRLYSDQHNLTPVLRTGFMVRTDNGCAPGPPRRHLLQTQGTPHQHLNISKRMEDAGSTNDITARSKREQLTQQTSGTSSSRLPCVSRWCNVFFKFRELVEGHTDCGTMKPAKRKNIA